MFPRSRVAQPDFEEVAQRYYKRQDRVVAEDNAISVQQQRGLRAGPVHPGRFAAKERIVHALDNWVLDRVLAPAQTATIHPLKRSA